MAAAATLATAGAGTAQAVYIPLPFGASVNVTGGLAIGTNFTSIWANPQLNIAGVLPWGWGSASGGVMPLGGAIGFWGGQVNWPAGWIGDINAFGINWPINAGGSLGSLGCWAGACPAYGAPYGWVGAYFPFGTANAASVAADPAAFSAGGPTVPVQTTVKPTDVPAPVASPMSAWSIRIPGLFGGSLTLNPYLNFWVGTSVGASAGVSGNLTLPWGWGWGDFSANLGAISGGWDGVEWVFPSGSIGPGSAFGLYIPATLWGDLGAVGANWWPWFEWPAAGVSTAVAATGQAKAPESTFAAPVEASAPVTAAPLSVPEARTTVPSGAGAPALPVTAPQGSTPSAAPQQTEAQQPTVTQPTVTQQTGTQQPESAPSGPVSRVLESVVSGLRGGASAPSGETGQSGSADAAGSSSTSGSTGASGAGSTSGAGGAE